MIETVALIQKTPDCIAVDWALKQHVSIYLPDKIALMVCVLESDTNTARLESSTFQWLWFKEAR